MLGHHALFPSRIGTRLGVLAVATALLVPAAPAGAQVPQPRIAIDRQFDLIEAHDFAANTQLTITIDSAAVDDPPMTDGFGFAEYNAFEAGFDLEPGDVVSVSDGTTIKDLTVADIVIKLVDPVTDTVTGTAPAGTDEVELFVSDHDALHVETTAVPDGAGNWSASFPDPDGGTLDIDWTMFVAASVADTDGDDADFTNTAKEPPRIEMFPQWGGVNASGFLGGTSLSLDIDDGTTFHADVVSDAYGTVEFNLPEDCCGGLDVDLEPGMLVEVSDGPTTKDVTVMNLSIDVVDLDLATVKGTAAPGAPLRVSVFDPAAPDHDALPQEVTAEAGGATAGHWEASFAAITTTTRVHAKAPDLESDSTNRDFSPPRIFASQDPNWWGGLVVRAEEFTPATLVTLTVLSPGGDILLSETGPVDGTELNRNFGNLDAEPGMTIRVSDGVYTKELEIARVTIDNVDPTADEVSGTAPPGAAVDVSISEDGVGGQQKTVHADGAGDWTAAFDSDFGPETDAFAGVNDPDDDMNTAEKFRRIAGIDASLGRLMADGYAAESQITFEVWDAPEGDGGTLIDSSDSLVPPVMSDEFGHAEYSPGVALAGGMEVVVSDGFGERRAVLPNITIDDVDPTLDEASGTGPPTTSFAAGSLCGLTQHTVTTDGSGNWLLTDYAFDIIHTAEACSPSPAPAGVDIRWSKSVPVVTVDPLEDLITADGFDPAGGNITFEIYSAPGGTPLHSEPVAPRDFTNGNGVTFSGHAELPRTAHGEDLAPGMFVRATQNTTPTPTVKEHEIAPLTVDVADPVTSAVSGTAEVPTNGELVVALDLQFVLRPEVDGNGNWEITEADRAFLCGDPPEPCVWQIEHEAIIEASVVDPQGDRTLVPQGAAEAVTCNAATSCTTDNESPADGSTEFDPVETRVTSPSAGTIRIAEEQLTRQAPDSFAFLGQQVDIDAPDASVANPLEIVLSLDATRIPKGKTVADLMIYRNGNYVPDCGADSAGQASPDPCVSAREKLGDGDAQLTMRSSQASDWNAGASNDARPPTLDSASFSVNPKTSSQTTVLSATASDALSGVGGGEFFIGADPGKGAGQQMALSGSSLEGTIGSLAPGTHDVGVRARDKAGNWSSVTTLTLTVEPDPASGGGGGGGVTPTPSPSASATPSPSVSVSPSPEPSEPPIDARCEDPGVVCGTDGNDVLTGTDGPDLIIGGDGDDIITGGDGDDVCKGGSGNDTIDCGEGNDRIRGGAGDDELRSTAGDDDIRGGAGTDTIRGGVGDDVLRGGVGADLIRGGPGADRLFGGAGRDTLYGGPDDDLIVGGTGRDLMRGGGGDDRFRARDGYVDQIFGGRGRDRARRDDFDEVLSL